MSGKLYCEAITKESIKPGETKSVYLTLTKIMTGEDTGIVNNIAEIETSSNALGIKDNDSIPGNNNKNEDDYSYANVVLTIKTGKTILYTSLAISMFIVLSVGIYLINKKVLQA